MVVGIVGILALIAYPNYMGSVRQSRRQGAITALNKLQLSQERYRAENPTYGSLSELVTAYGVTGTNGVTPDGYYTLSITSPTASGYIATATAVAGTSQVDDTADGVSCASLSVNQDQPVDAGTGAPLSTQKACWGR